MSDMKYVKFTTERDLRFCTITKIAEEDGNVKVYKESYDKSSDAHVKKNIDTYNMYKKLMKDTGMNICRCGGWNPLDIEYIKGKSLEKYMDELVENNDKDGIFDLICQYAERMKQIHPKVAFEKTEAFISVFGDVLIESNTEATDFLNIDMIFPNLIIRDNQWVAIDYEWTFDFPIPIHFLIYRCVLYYSIGNGKRAYYVNLDTLKQLGMTESEILTYTYMEKNFQKYVEGNCKPLREYGCFLENVPVMVYYDYGQGYSRENSEVVLASMNSLGVIHLHFQLPEKLCSVKVKLCENSCMVRVLDANMEWSSNGKSIMSDTILFSTKEPQLIFEEGLEKELNMDFLVMMDKEGTLLRDIQDVFQTREDEYERLRFAHEKLRIDLTLATRRMVQRDSKE